MHVGTMPIHTIADVQQAMKCQKAEGHLHCELLMAHPELRDGLIQEGIPQIHIDHLNSRYIINAQFITNQHIPIVASGGVYDNKDPLVLNTNFA